MNNEPVAWMDYLEHSDVYDLNVSGRGIPLYTHPVKELTDEEKWKLWGECPNGLVYDRVMLFADLVIRKVQEK